MNTRTWFRGDQEVCREEVRVLPAFTNPKGERNQQKGKKALNMAYNRALNEFCTRHCESVSGAQEQHDRTYISPQTNLRRELFVDSGYDIFNAWDSKDHFE